MKDGSKMTVQQIRSSEKFTFLLAGLPVTTLIHPAGAVVGRSLNRELINVWSCVNFSAAPGEVCIHVNIYLDNNYLCRRTLHYWQLVSVGQTINHSVLYNSLSTWIRLVIKSVMSMIALY